jgi:hypothetical protein
MRVEYIGATTNVAWEGDFGDFDALGTYITNLFG